VIAQAGAPRDLYERPQTSFVAGFMGEALLFDAVSRSDGRVDLGPLAIEPAQRLRPGSVKVAVRPEAWVVAPRGVAAGPGQLAGTLTKLAYLGHGLELSFDTALGPVFLITSDADRPWQVGDSAALSLAQRGVSVVAS
jgi:iron(III) transport system ATP-binding protein